MVITNTKGIYSDSVAEYAVWALLTLFRRYHLVLRNQFKHRWRQISGPGLKGKVIGVLGLGNVGNEIAIRIKAFGTKVIAFARQVPVQNTSLSVDEIYSFKDLRTKLKEFDALVLCVPLTRETRGLINVDVIKGMKAGAFLVDCSRAGVRDDGSLVQALKQGKLAGAALDVFEQEPLSRWSRLWNIDNLLVTPHLAALTADYQERVGALICQNVIRFNSNQPLLNIVDREKGY